MKNKILIFIMVILIVILGVVVYINCKKTNTTNANDNYSLILEKIGIQKENDKYKEGNYCKLNVSKQIDDNLYIESIVVNNYGMFGTLEQIQFSYNEIENEENNGNYLIRVVDENNDVIGEFDLPTAQIKTGEDPIVYKYMSELKNNKDYKILIYNNENYDDIESGKEEPISTIDFMYNEN